MRHKQVGMPRDAVASGRIPRTNGALKKAATAPLSTRCLEYIIVYNQLFRLLWCGQSGNDRPG
jgi:hypothetical protein